MKAGGGSAVMIAIFLWWLYKTKYMVPFKRKHREFPTAFFWCWLVVMTPPFFPILMFFVLNDYLDAND
jgi:hypothetical protein